MPALYQQLINQARKLAAMDPRRPGQGNLRRSVSSAYYALFHFLIEQSTRRYIGAAASDAGLRALMARGYGHDEIYVAAKSFAGGTLPDIVTRSIGPISIPGGLKSLAQLFLEAQDQRHEADYDLAARLLRANVFSLLERIEKAFRAWPRIQNDSATRLFLHVILVWKRIKDR